MSSFAVWGEHSESCRCWMTSKTRQIIQKWHSSSVTYDIQLIINMSFIRWQWVLSDLHMEELVRMCLNTLFNFENYKRVDYGPKQNMFYYLPLQTMPLVLGMKFFSVQLYTYREYCEFYFETHLKKCCSTESQVLINLLFLWSISYTSNNISITFSKSVNNFNPEYSQTSKCRNCF